jgi:hypothetical protein
MLKQEEDRHADRKTGMEAATEMLLEAIAKKKMEYDEFVFSI